MKVAVGKGLIWIQNDHPGRGHFLGKCDCGAKNGFSFSHPRTNIKENMWVIRCRLTNELHCKCLEVVGYNLEKNKIFQWRVLLAVKFGQKFLNSLIIVVQLKKEPKVVLIIKARLLSYHRRPIQVFINSCGAKKKVFTNLRFEHMNLAFLDHFERILN